MDENFLDDIVTTSTPSTRHALLIAALLHLMSQYTLRHRGGATGVADDDAPCIKLAAVIERHLDALSRLPDAEPVLRATCEQLRAKWADLVDSRLPPPTPPRRALLARILRPNLDKMPALAG